ncbi:hypothetical protein D3C74_351890 [compost metagenome]
MQIPWEMNMLRNMEGSPQVNTFFKKSGDRYELLYGNTWQRSRQMEYPRPLTGNQFMQSQTKSIEGIFFSFRCVFLGFFCNNLFVTHENPLLLP